MLRSRSLIAAITGLALVCGSASALADPGNGKGQGNGKGNPQNSQGHASKGKNSGVAIGIMAQASIALALLGLLVDIGTTGAPDLHCHPAFKRTSLEVSRFHPGLPKSWMAG